MLLTIYLTKKCNLDCSFCGNKINMNDDTKPVSDLDVILENHLFKYGDNYHAFAISGGEPLIDSIKLEKVLSVLLSHSLDKPIIINTNACYLTDNMVAVFNTFPNIKINISLDGLSNDERGLFKLLGNDYKFGYGTLDCIKKINNKEISLVITNENLNNFNLPLEIDLMYKYFNCDIKISLDSTKEALQNFSVDNAYDFQLLVEKLELLNLLNNGVIIKNFFDGICNGKNIKAMSWTGEIFYECVENGNNCNYRRKNMKIGMYDLLYNIYNAYNFKFDRTAQDKPNYDNQIGYQGERNSIIPVRKHWLDNQISIKQVK